MRRSGSPGALPAWAGLLLVPAINVAVALALSALVILSIGEHPGDALWVMLRGALGNSSGIGYTLYYATSLIFTGLAVSVAYHAGLFNIGGEGQAYLGGLGVGLVCLWMGDWPWWLGLPLTILAAGAFGGAWALIPGWLQAYRGSHVVITTIMFNFIASSLMVYLLVNVLIRPGQMSPESRPIAESLQLPKLGDWLPVDFGSAPVNISFLLALLFCVLVWALIWHSRTGFALRTVGANEEAARYAGIDTRRMVVLAMVISGALAGMLGVNEIQGVQHRLILNFPAGIGFTGIAVALMGRAHPAGIVPAAILFGALYQGGAELAFEYQSISPQLVVVIQGIVILFAGAMESLFRPLLLRLFGRRPTSRSGGGDQP